MAHILRIIHTGKCRFAANPHFQKNKRPRRWPYQYALQQQSSFSATCSNPCSFLFDFPPCLSCAMCATQLSFEFYE